MPTKYYSQTFEITVADTGTYSSVFYIGQWAVFVGIFFPAMTDGAIGLELSFDGSSFYPLLDPTDGADAILCTAGSDPGFVDISDWVRFVAPEMHCRITCAAQSGAKTLKVMMRG